jgi:uncharacterized protein (TIGR00661 family)
MKILYAVQATGNGHISRAMELIPHLRRYATVDVFLSGSNSHLPIDVPVIYRSKGVSLYHNSTGGLDYWKIIRGIHPLTLRKEINDLPVEKYDLIINDFEFITAASCAKKKIPSVQLGHQASFQSPLTPRPRIKNAFGEWILKNYARTSYHIGLHFEQYDDFIFHPVIKKEILDAEPVDKGHITIYLPSYPEYVLEKIFRSFRYLQFHIFSKETKQPVKKNNILFFPVNKMLFNQSLIECTGIVTGAGFETPAEALYLGKKIMAIPSRGQYEQQCNAAALQKLGVTCPQKIDANFQNMIYQWLNTKNLPAINYKYVIPQVLDCLFAIHANMKRSYGNDSVEMTYNSAFPA